MNKKPTNKFNIDEKNHGMRLDNYLVKTIKGIPQKKIYSMIRKGEVRINSKRVKPKDKVRSGDIVRIPPNLTYATKELVLKVKPESLSWIEDTIIYEDDSFLVLNKPSGIAVHGGSGISGGIIELLRLHRKNIREDLELVHRIDKDTSGCLLISKKRSRLRKLHTYFREGQVKKNYIGLLVGKTDENNFTVDQPLNVIRANNNQRMAIPDIEGKKSITLFNRIKKYNDCSLYNIKPLTGRTHQIRAHTKFLKSSLAGDERYGKQPDIIKKSTSLNRLFLHAESISFPCLSENGQNFKINCDLPKSLQKVLDEII
jgi:23S rRNA pseudouridine955/2504/2580 synthase|tara:strand:- start:93 stop:1034 length:942 start_codon:yes stop_codon:yes gene_type:complete